MTKQATSINRTVAEHSLAGIRYIMFPLWLIIMLIVAAIVGTISYFEEFDRSIWASGASASKIYVGVIGIILSLSILPLYVTNGVTRRHFVIGGSIVVAGVAVLSGLLSLAGFGVEELIYNQAGIGDVIEDQSAFGSVGRAILVVVAYAIANAAYMSSGWLIGSGYYRFGGLGGTLFLLVALIPVAVVEFLLNLDDLWDSGTSIGGPVAVYMAIPERIIGDINIPVAIAALAALAVTAGGLLVNHRILRDVTIK